MTRCDCQLGREELDALVRSEKPEEREAAIAHVVHLLTSADPDTRRQGYALFEEGISEALFCSCLNYGSLASGFTEPLVDILVRAVEFWAAPAEARQQEDGRAE
jgi:hypothetical protein